MLVPLSWLRDFAPFEGDPADLAAALSELGLAVEGLEMVGEGLDGIRVARVDEVRPHPGADRVQLVDVDAGEGPVQVVCGAFNFAVGDLVPFVPPGTTLPGGMAIERRKVRGEWSNGILASAAELNLSDDHSGIMVLAPALQLGAPLGEALGLRPDVVFDIDVTPNRPDALSMAGVARDLAARLRLPFQLAELPAPRDGAAPGVSLAVEAPDLCPRFTATRFQGVGAGPSPGWLASRLTLAGMRSINGVVDVSNYVMLELGHPNHPYDLARLSGRGLLVRRGRPGEAVLTLDEVERAVGAGDCLICDAEGTPIGIGGIMGGASTEITVATTDVLLEMAYFSPLAIARTSKRLGLRTEASVRFERGVDPHGIDRAVARFGQLVEQLGAPPGPGAGTGRASTALATIDVRGPLPDPPKVVVRTDRVNATLGTDLTPDAVAGYLEPMGFGVEGRSGGELEVVVPSWRPDTEREIDVIEEVARHHGYGNVARTLPAIRRAGGLTPYQRDRRRVREVLVGAGLSEAWTTSLVSSDDLERAGLPPGAVEVENPLAKEESVLRTSLLPGLLEALVTNQAHRSPDVALFEIGHVFVPPAAGAVLPAEPELLAAALAGRPAPDAKLLWDTLATTLGVDSVEIAPARPPGMHPTRSARISVAGGLIGAVGEVDPDVLSAHGLRGPVAWIDVDLGALLGAPRRSRTYRPVSRFPSADVDLAFEVPDTVPADVVARALRASTGLIQDVRLFDVFRGGKLQPGRRSLAFRVRFAAIDHTLGDDELVQLRDRCIAAVESEAGATLRS